jgi:uncharacterized protein
MALPAHAQSFPKSSGLVVDAANVLPADRKAALEQKLEALQQQTKHQLVVATIPDLQGYDVSDYGYRLGRAWGVGLKGADNGAILIVAPNDRKVRVEVGYGLEGVLTDAFSSVVINQQILPRFKAGDIPGGIEAGADAIAQQLRLPDDLAKAKAAAAAQAYDKTHRRSNGGGFPLGLIFWLVLVAAFIGLRWFGRSAGARTAYRSTGSGGGGSNWPIWLWAASELMDDHRRHGGGGGGGFFGGDSGGGGGNDGGWGGGGFTGGGGGSFGGGGASGSW